MGSLRALLPEPKVSLKMEWNHPPGCPFVGLQALQNVLLGIDALLGGSPGDGFDTAHASSHTAFAQNADKADAARALGMTTAAELNAVGKLNHADAVAVFLAEEGDGTELLGLLSLIHI